MTEETLGKKLSGSDKISSEYMKTLMDMVIKGRMLSELDRRVEERRNYQWRRECG